MQEENTPQLPQPQPHEDSALVAEPKDVSTSQKEVAPAQEAARPLDELPSIDSFSISELRVLMRCPDPYCSCHLSHGNFHCPTHKGMDPTLALKKNKNGKLLCKCHRGCSGRKLRDALRRVIGARLQERADGNDAVPFRYEKSANTPASEIAIWFNLIERTEDGGWVGPNPFNEEGGATDNAFVLSKEGIAYDRHLEKSYSHKELVELVVKIENASQRAAYALRRSRTSNL